ncbi:MAG: hypothetical protein AAGE03_02765 [Pseudomonadota bacterium]
MSLLIDPAMLEPAVEITLISMAWFVADLKFAMAWSKVGAAGACSSTGKTACGASPAEDKDRTAAPSSMIGGSIGADALSSRRMAVSTIFVSPTGWGESVG